MTEPTTALRDNQGKPQLSELLYFDNALDALAAVLAQGSIKYETLNWLRGGKPDSEYLDAAVRHIRQHKLGEFYDSDPETGIGTQSLANAAWNLLACLTLNYATEPSIDPEFDQEAFIERWSDDDEDEGDTEFTGTSVHGLSLPDLGKEDVDFLADRLAKSWRYESPMILPDDLADQAEAKLDELAAKHSNPGGFTSQPSRGLHFADGGLVGSPQYIGHSVREEAPGCVLPEGIVGSIEFELTEDQKRLFEQLLSRPEPLDLHLDADTNRLEVRVGEPEHFGDAALQAEESRLAVEEDS